MQKADDAPPCSDISGKVEVVLEALTKIVCADANEAGDECSIPSIVYKFG